MSNEEKFVQETIKENTTREIKDDDNYEKPEANILNEITPAVNETAETKKKLSDIRSDFQKMNASAEILSSSSTPRSEINKSKQNFLDKLFSKKN